MTPERKTMRSSGNIFADLDLPNPEEHLAKAMIVSRIYDVISKRKISQKEAARILQIDQPRVSDLLNGRFSRFSTGKLFQFLLALGQNVKIIISDTHGTPKKASLSISIAKQRKLRGTKAA